MKLTPKKLSLPVVGAVLIGLLASSAAIAAFTATRTASVAVDADAVNAGPQPSVSVTGDTATITFPGVTLEGGRSVEGYRLLRSDGAEITCSASPCLDAGLPPGGYSYQVLGVYKSWSGAYGPVSDATAVATPGLSFTNGGTPSCAGGSVSLPAGTTSWSSAVSRAYADSTDATTVTVTKTAGTGTVTGSPLTIEASSTESTGSVTLSGLTNGTTATLSAAAEETSLATCNISVAAVDAARTIRITALAGTTDRSGNSNNFSATITVTVKDQADSAASGVAVTGVWSVAGATPNGCTTDATGSCSFSTSLSAEATVDRVWTVSSLTKPNHMQGSNAVSTVTCRRSATSNGQTNCTIS